MFQTRFPEDHLEILKSAPLRQTEKRVPFKLLRSTNIAQPTLLQRVRKIGKVLGEKEGNLLVVAWTLGLARLSDFSGLMSGLWILMRHQLRGAPASGLWFSH